MLHNLSRRSFVQGGAFFLALPVISQFFGCRGSEQFEPEKKAYPHPKFELIDLALQHEFGAVVQYSNHAGIIAAMRKDPGGSIGNYIREIIDQEVHHAILLTDILKRNNIEPTIAVWPAQRAATADEMIQKDISAELGAIKLYQQILSLDHDDQTKKIIDSLLLAEETHHHMFAKILTELV